MTEIVTEHADAVEEAIESDAPTVGTPPTQASSVESILEEELVEDVSIDGMCGVY